MPAFMRVRCVVNVFLLAELNNNPLAPRKRGKNDSPALTKSLSPESVVAGKLEWIVILRHPAALRSVVIRYRLRTSGLLMNYKSRYSLLNEWAVKTEPMFLFLRYRPWPFNFHNIYCATFHAPEGEKHLTLDRLILTRKNGFEQIIINESKINCSMEKKGLRD